MSRIVTIEGAVYFDTRSLCDEYREPYKFFGGSVHNWDSYVVAAPHTISLMLPESFDPRPIAVQALEAKREKLKAEFAASVAAINAQISKLTAIGYEVPA
jgi:hypothetical protein